MGGWLKKLRARERMSRGTWVEKKRAVFARQTGTPMCRIFAILVALALPTSTSAIAAAHVAAPSRRPPPSMLAADDRWAAAREAGERTSQRTDLLARSLLAARACSLAFVPPSAIRYEPYAKGLRCVAQIEDPATLSGATVLETAAGEVVLACRGSASFKNFGTTTDIGPEPLLANPMARVHRGFQRASEGMWPLLRPHLPATGGRLLVTGHSLGGGTATLLALKCEAAGLTPELITVAGPRLGDAAFASHYRERCGEAVHLVHERDEVLTSNTKLWDDLGFAHVGRVARRGCVRLARFGRAL